MHTLRCKVIILTIVRSAGEFTMLRFVTVLSVLALASAANIFQIDLDPEEAAKYINSPPFTVPELSARTAVLPLIKYNDPRFRAAEAGPSLGHYWKNGKEIENPEDYIEEVYNAAQYHGQDGLGGYGYGYKAPESAKVENRQRSGDVTGSYTYKSGRNDIKVRYWADSQGFHQEDNIPKYVPKPVEEAPEVRAARIAHEKAWNEAAYANLHPGAAAAAAQVQQPSLGAYQPQQGSYQAQAYQAQPSNNYQQQASYQQNYQAQPAQGNYQNYQKSYDFQSAASEQQGSVVPAPGLREARQYQNQDYTTTTTTEEPTGPPRGFFYSFEYPVNIIKSKKEDEEDSVNPGYPLDSDTISQYGHSQ